MIIIKNFKEVDSVEDNGTYLSIIDECACSLCCFQLLLFCLAMKFLCYLPQILPSRRREFTRSIFFVTLNLEHDI